MDCRKVSVLKASWLHFWTITVPTHRWKPITFTQKKSSRTNFRPMRPKEKFCRYSERKPISCERTKETNKETFELSKVWTKHQLKWVFKLTADHNCKTFGLSVWRRRSNKYSLKIMKFKLNRSTSTCVFLKSPDNHYSKGSAVKMEYSVERFATLYRRRFGTWCKRTSL